MKKTMCLLTLCAVALCAGCAGTNTAATPSAANTPMTLDEALQKSADTRQKLIDAKKQYEAVTTASDAGQSAAAAATKQEEQNKINAAKEKINAEKQAWKDALSD